MNRIDVELDYLPAVVVTLQGEVSDDAYLAYLNRLTGVLRTHRARGVIIDASLSEMHSPRHAKMQADWVNQNRAMLKQHVLLTALVVDRPVLRFALSAFFAITSMPTKFVITSTCVDARFQVAQALGSAGVSVPDGFTTVHAGAGRARAPS